MEICDCGLRSGLDFIYYSDTLSCFFCPKNSTDTRMKRGEAAYDQILNV